MSDAAPASEVAPPPPVSAELVVAELVAVPLTLAMVPLALGDDEGGAAGVAALVGIPLGIGGAIWARRLELSPGQAATVVNGQLVGLAAAGLLAADLEPSTSGTAAWILGGSVVGLGAGAAAAALVDVPEGDAALHRAGFVWGLYAADLTFQLSPAVRWTVEGTPYRERPGAVAGRYLAGGAAGLGASVALSLFVDPPRQDVAASSALGLVAAGSTFLLLADTTATPATRMALQLGAPAATMALAAAVATSERHEVRVAPLWDPATEAKGARVVVVGRAEAP